MPKHNLLVLHISQIRRDGGTQSRVAMDEATVERYAADLRDGRWEWGEHNALVVFRDHAAQNWLADGFHRIEAIQRAGLTQAKCVLYAGERRDAVIFAAGANAGHGLGRSRDDVQRSIKTLLLDEEWRKWSDREIAKKVRCDHKTVGSLREKLIASGEIPHEEERTYTRAGATHTQAAPPPPARPASAPPLAEYEAAVKTLADCGHKLTCGGLQRGLPPYWIVDPQNAPKRYNTWAEVEERMEQIATETPLLSSTDYEAMIAVANNVPALTHLRLTIAADKAIGPAQHDALQAAITRRSEQLDSPAAQPAAEALPAQVDVVVGPYAYLKSCVGCGTTEFLLRSPDGKTWFCESCSSDFGTPFHPERLSPADRARRLGGELECRHKGTTATYVLVFPGQQEQAFAEDLRAACAVLSEMERSGQPDRLADLTARAAARGYTVAAHGGSWRIRRGESPMGAVRDLDELEHSVIAWEQAQERAQEPEQVAPAAPADETGVQLQHINQTLAGLMGKASEDELRVLYYLIFDTIPDGYEGEDWQEDIWQASKDLFRQARPKELMWVLGEAVAQ